VRRLAVIAAAVLLASCAGRPIREAPPVAADAALATQAAREATLAADPEWSLAGRVALANGERGGSGRLDWRQAGPRAEVSLSAPITRQSWRLVADPAGATLEGLEGGTRHGAEAGRLLLESTGWRIPVEALPFWLRGARAPGMGEATLAFGPDGRLARMEQGGWTILYDRWGLDDTAGLALPHRLEASRDDARVRLLVETWGAEPADG